MWPFSKRGSEERRSLDSVPWGNPTQQWGAGGPAPWEGGGEERALRLVPVFGAIRFLADNIAAMAPGLGLYKLVKDDIAERQPTPSLFANPSIHGTLFDWLHKAVISMCLRGDGIGLITQRDYLGFPTMIEWLNPINVQTLDRAIEGPGSYVDPRWYWWGRPMDPADLLHIPWFCLPWRVRGLTPMMAYATTMNVGLGAEHMAEGWYRNGGVPPGTYRNTVQKVLPDDADEIAARQARRIRRGEPLVYGMDWEYNPIQISAMEARFVETSSMVASQIAVIYGVPPHKIGGTIGDSLTYSTVEQESIDVLQFSFRPWLTRFEYAFSTCFPRGQFVRFETDEFIRVDAKTRAEIDNISLGFQNTGWLDRDEVRAGRNLKPGKVPTQWTAAMAPPAAPGGPTPKKESGAQPAPGNTKTAPPGASSAATTAVNGMMRGRVNGSNGHAPAAATKGT
jgi:HK97 family phage portal protein